MNQSRLSILLGALLAVFIGTRVVFSASKKEDDSKPTMATVKLPDPTREIFDREVDRAALASQDKAIAKLKSLLKKYRGRSQEPILLIKLGDLYRQSSDIQFRIAHGRSRSGKSPELNAFKSTTKQAISTFSEVIGKYPHFVEIYEAYYNRGKCYEDLDLKESATRDYLYLVKNFPDVDQVIPAYMSLAEFSIDANNHPKAIQYLMEVNKHPESPYYPFALYKLAWSHFNLKNTAKALEFSETQIQYYNELDKRKTNVSGITSDVALKETTLVDIPVFYFQGYEDNSSSYGIDHALDYFKKLESGPILGRMSHRFAKLLRSHSHEKDLLQWKNLFLAKEFDRPESLDILVTTYEYQLNRRLWSQLIDSTRDMVKLYEKHSSFEAFPKAQKLLLDTAQSLQESIVKNKTSDTALQMSKTLAEIYDSFTKIVDEKDPRIPRVHYNLAETLFTIKDYIGATTHYRWVVNHSNKWELPKQKKSDFNIVEASLKAISSRYEVLRQKKFIPKDLVAVSISQDSDRKLDPEIAEWIKWLDKHVQLSPKDTESFQFEAARALYAQGHIREALQRLERFASQNSTSKYAISAASLVLDTQIASQDWKQANETAENFREIKAFKKTDFSDKLFKIAGDTWYKRIELAKKEDTGSSASTAISLSNDFLRNYPKSERLSDVLVIAGNSALKINDKEKAKEYFSKLIELTPKSEHIPAALGARASIEEAKYNFARASADYRALLGLPPQKIKLDEGKLDNLRKKALLLTWLSADDRELSEAVQNKSICSESLKLECEQYLILTKLASGETKTSESAAKDAFEMAHKKREQKNLKALWAILALEGTKYFSFRDRNHLLKHIANGWEALEPLMQFALAPRLFDLIPSAIQKNRLSLKSVAPLKADERWITHRVDVIKELESTVTKVVKLPWARIRAEALGEIAQVYLDLSQELTSLPPPKNLSPAEQAAYEETLRGLVLPFEEKGHDIRTKAFEIASGFAIEDAAYQAIAEPFFAENPSLAQTIRPRTKWQAPREFDLDFLAFTSDDSRWSAIIRSPGSYDGSDLGLRLKSLWTKALKQKKWQQVAYFIQESREKKQSDPASLILQTVVALSTIGARSEALVELEDNISTFRSAIQTPIMMNLIRYYVRASSKDKTQALLKKIPKESLSREQESFISLATAYTNQSKEIKPSGRK